mmetsp:Transcript_67086/g.218408  ORF Transcript_67086/g.218408 Transcript_67086/m.218408 type:complete len:482 (+) Transcript_67086:1838-3283(+)
MRVQEDAVLLLHLAELRLDAVQMIALPLEVQQFGAVLHVQVLQLLLQVSALLDDLGEVLFRALELVPERIPLALELLPDMRVVLALPLQLTDLPLLAHALLRQPLDALLLVLELLLQLQVLALHAVVLLLELPHLLLVTGSRLLRLHNGLLEGLCLALQHLHLIPVALELALCRLLHRHLLLEARLQERRLLVLLVKVLLQGLRPPRLVQEAHLGVDSELDLLLVLLHRHLMLRPVHVALAAQPHLILPEPPKFLLQAAPLRHQLLRLVLKGGDLVAELGLELGLFILVASLHQRRQALALLLALPRVLEHRGEGPPKHQQRRRGALRSAHRLLQHRVQALRVDEHCPVDPLGRLGIQAELLEGGVVDAELRQTLHLLRCGAADRTIGLPSLGERVIQPVLDGPPLHRIGLPVCADWQWGGGVLYESRPGRRLRLLLIHHIRPRKVPLAGHAPCRDWNSAACKVALCLLHVRRVRNLSAKF